MKSLSYPALAGALLVAGTPAIAQHAGHTPGMTMPNPQQPATPPTEAVPPPVDHSTMDHGAMDHGAMTNGASSHAGHSMKAALGSYSINREASGTSWQPDTSRHLGLMTSAGDWMLMGHGVLNLVADTQGGPRGDDKLFVSGMVMGMAQRPVGQGTLQFKTMLSPDPLMGKAGYPLLLASGETADGVNRLIDRQHPHDLFVELSASLSQPLGGDVSAFIYGGLPGEPAFGPPTFMHRESIMDSPEAPITHHWFDSTHISFGVLTAGLITGRAKVEVSRFNGREPDQYRYNIETGPLDSTAVRVSVNPTAELALQASYGHFIDSEQLEPGVNQHRLSASAMYTRDLGQNTRWASSLAWARKTAEGHGDDAFLIESSLSRGGWTLFGRGEVTENRELVEDEEEGHGEAFTVAKASLGVVRDFRLGKGPVKLGAGVLGSVNVLPRDLAPLYGGRHPLGAMAFVRIKVE